MSKVQSYLVEDGGPDGLHRKYEEIYQKSDAWLYTKSHGVHSVVLGEIKEEIKDKRVLDMGCGAGRLAIMCAHSASHVDGIDFSESAVFIAERNAECCGITNIRFHADDISTFDPGIGMAYDVITSIGVLEHVPDPLVTLRRLNSMLAPGGLAVVSCPNFLNFRGHTYMTLLTLFGLPMSLADLRQVDYHDIQQWSAQSGFNHERTVGAIYGFAWGEKAITDMIKRVPAALSDKPISADLDHDSYQKWLHKNLDSNTKFLQYLEEASLLKRIQRQVKLQFKKTADVPEGLWDKMNQYIDEDITTDPYYCDVEPFCYFGGEGIYFLRKQSEAR